MLNKNNLKNLQKSDPVKRNVEKGLEGQEMSPMDPPEAFEPPKVEEVPYEDMHPVLQGLMDEHKEIKKELDTFEEALHQIQKEGVTKEADKKLRNFFHFFDEVIVKHSQKEEKTFFELLHKRLIEKGEHSHGPTPTTSIDILEEDHTKILQLGAVIFNFLGLASRLPDQKSCVIVLDIALEQGKSLVELLRLHSFREDTIIFPLAHKYISKAEFDGMSEGSFSC